MGVVVLSLGREVLGVVVCVVGAVVPVVVVLEDPLVELPEGLDVSSSLFLRQPAKRLATSTQLSARIANFLIFFTS